MANYYQGAEDFSFMGFGRSMHCFYGAREHETPHGWGPWIWWLGGGSFSPKLFHWASQNYIFICLFDLILYVPANGFRLCLDRSSWVDQY